MSGTRRSGRAFSPPYRRQSRNPLPGSKGKKSRIPSWKKRKLYDSNRRKEFNKKSAQRRKPVGIPSHGKKKVSRKILEKKRVLRKGSSRYPKANVFSPELSNRRTDRGSCFEWTRKKFDKMKFSKKFKDWNRSSEKGEVPLKTNFSVLPIEEFSLRDRVDSSSFREFRRERSNLGPRSVRRVFEHVEEFEVDSPPPEKVSGTVINLRDHSLAELKSLKGEFEGEITIQRGNVHAVDVDDGVEENAKRELEMEVKKTRPKKDDIEIESLTKLDFNEYEGDDDLYLSELLKRKISQTNGDLDRIDQGISSRRRSDFGGSLRRLDEMGEELSRKRASDYGQDLSRWNRVKEEAGEPEINLGVQRRNLGEQLQRSIDDSRSRLLIDQPKEVVVQARVGSGRSGDVAGGVELKPLYQTGAGVGTKEVNVVEDEDSSSSLVEVRQSLLDIQEKALIKNYDSKKQIVQQLKNRAVAMKQPDTDVERIEKKLGQINDEFLNKSSELKSSFVKDEKMESFSNDEEENSLANDLLKLDKMMKEFSKKNVEEDNLTATGNEFMSPSFNEDVLESDSDDDTDLLSQGEEEDGLSDENEVLSDTSESPSLKDQSFMIDSLKDKYTELVNAAKESKVIDDLDRKEKDIMRELTDKSRIPTPTVEVSNPPTEVKRSVNVPAIIPVPNRAWRDIQSELSKVDEDASIEDISSEVERRVSERENILKRKYEAQLKDAIASNIQKEKIRLEEEQNRKYHRFLSQISDLKEDLSNAKKSNITQERAFLTKSQELEEKIESREKEAEELRTRLSNLASEHIREKSRLREEYEHMNHKFKMAHDKELRTRMEEMERKRKEKRDEVNAILKENIERVASQYQNLYKEKERNFQIQMSVLRREKESMEAKLRDEVGEKKKEMKALRQLHQEKLEELKKEFDVERKNTERTNKEFERHFEEEVRKVKEELENEKRAQMDLKNNSDEEIRRIQIEFNQQKNDLRLQILKAEKSKEEELLNLRMKHESLQRELETNLREKIESEASTKVKELSRKLQSTESENRRLTDSMRSLEELNERYLAEIKGNESKVSMLNNKAKRLEEENFDYSNDIALLRSRLRDMEEQVEVFNKRVVELEEENQNSGGEKEEILKKNELLESQEKRIKELERKNRSLMNTMSDFNLRISEKDSVIIDLKEKTKDYESKMAQFLQDKKDFEVMKKEKETELNNLISSKKKDRDLEILEFSGESEFMFDGDKRKEDAENEDQGFLEKREEERKKWEIEEEKKRKEELKRKMEEEEEERKRFEMEKHKEEEERRRILEIEQEEKRERILEEERRKKEEEERRRIEIEKQEEEEREKEERRRILEMEEEEERRILEDERRRKEEEEKRLIEEERRKKEEEEKRLIEEERRKEEEEEEERKKIFEEEEKRISEMEEEEEMKRDERRKKEEEKKRLLEEERRKKEEEEERKKEEEERKRLLEEEEKKRVIEEEKRKKEEEKKRLLEEEKRKKEEEEEEKILEEEKRKREIEEEKKKKRILEEEEERKKEEERKRKLEEEKRKKDLEEEAEERKRKLDVKRKEEDLKRIQEDEKLKREKEMERMRLLQQRELELHHERLGRKPLVSNVTEELTDEVTEFILEEVLMQTVLDIEYSPKMNLGTLEDDHPNIFEDGEHSDGLEDDEESLDFALEDFAEVTKVNTKVDEAIIRDLSKKIEDRIFKNLLRDTVKRMERINEKV